MLKRQIEIVDETVAGILQLGAYAYFISRNAKYKDQSLQRQSSTLRKSIEPFVLSEHRPRRITSEYIQRLFGMIAPTKAPLTSTTVESSEQSVYSNILNLSMSPHEVPLTIPRPIDPRSIIEVELEKELHYCLALKKIDNLRFSIRLLIGMKTDQQGNNLRLSAIALINGVANGGKRFHLR